MNEFKFKAKVWLFPGGAGWHMVTLPVEMSKDIDFFHADKKVGFGSIRVKVTTGKTTWDTSIFHDRKRNSYVLPLKSTIRKKENIFEGDNVNFTINITKV